MDYSKFSLDLTKTKHRILLGPFFMNITPELIQRAQSGAQDAITALFTELFKILTYTEITAFLRGSSENVDVALITLQKMFKNLPNHEFESLERFISWVFKIHHNTAISWIRKNAVRSHIRCSESPYLEPAVPATDHERRDLFRVVYDFINQNENSRTCRILLLNFAGYSDEKIARKLQLPEGTVKSILRRTRKKIREYLETLEAPQNS